MVGTIRFSQRENSLFTTLYPANANDGHISGKWEIEDEL